jgi:RadC-like JAB domain
MTTSTISLIAQLQDGSSRSATSDEIISAARDHMSRRVRRGTQLSSPKATRDYLNLKLGSLEREVFAVIFLDKRHRLISYQEMFQGTIDGASVHPREVVKEALKQKRRGGDPGPPASERSRRTVSSGRVHHRPAEGSVGSGRYTSLGSHLRWILKCHHGGLNTGIARPPPYQSAGNHQ